MLIYASGTTKAIFNIKCDPEAITTAITFTGNRSITRHNFANFAAVDNVFRFNVVTKKMEFHGTYSEIIHSGKFEPTGVQLDKLNLN